MLLACHGVRAPQALPGFKRYAMERLAGEACCTGLLRAQPPLDARDGVTSTLLQDCATALKLVGWLEGGMHWR